MVSHGLVNCVRAKLKMSFLFFWPKPLTSKPTKHFVCVVFVQPIYTPHLASRIQMWDELWVIIEKKHEGNLNHGSMVDEEQI